MSEDNKIQDDQQQQIEKLKKEFENKFDDIKDATEDELEEIEEKLEEIEEELDDIQDDLEDESPDELFRQFNYLLGRQVLVITETQQLNLFGQTFRPIFCGRVAEVELGHITLTPVTVKLLNAPFYEFPTPISIPFEKIAHFTPDFDCDTRFPLI